MIVVLHLTITVNIYCLLFSQTNSDIGFGTGWESPQLQFINGTGTITITVNIYCLLFSQTNSDIGFGTGWESPQLQFINGTGTKPNSTNGNSPSAGGLSK